MHYICIVTKTKRMVNFKRKKVVLNLINAIQTAIDEECKKENYTIDYAEIDSALIKVLNDNNQTELKELWEEK